MCHLHLPDCLDNPVNCLFHFNAICCHLALSGCSTASGVSPHLVLNQERNYATNDASRGLVHDTNGIALHALRPPTVLGLGKRAPVGSTPGPSWQVFQIMSPR